MADPSLVLLSRMAISAAVVVTASLAAERGGPLLAAAIATLPLSIGPAYVFLALDHGPDFIAASALASVISASANSAFTMAYVAAARHNGTAVSIASALLAWVLFLSLVGQVAWTLPGALALSFGLSLVAIWATRRVRRYTHTVRLPIRPWHVLARAGAVMGLVAVVTLVGAWIGPRAAGLVAFVPIVFTSLAAIMQPTIGGRAVSAVLANGLVGMMGYAPAFALVHLTAERLGSFPALLLGLGVCLGWNAVAILILRAWR